ncbi:MAG: DUF6465 family protein [Lachnospiraceae bacterium]|nr:DUF6465 family protein [Lachnospiraceae bacterium]
MAEATKKVNVKDATATSTAKTAATSTATTAKASTAKKTTTTTAKKSATTKKAAAKKTTAKKATTAKKTTTKKASTAKKTTAKKAVTEKAHVQFAGKSFETAEVIKMCKEAFKAENKKKAMDELTVYINVDDSTAYYVVKSGKEEYQGKVAL